MSPIWLCGGSDLAGQLFRAGLIDELILKLNPVVFGTGIPLFSGGIGTTQFELNETKTYDCGIQRLHYRLVIGNQ